MAVEIGKTARLVQPVIQGEVIDTEYDKYAKMLRHLVRYTDPAGEEQTRWFTEEQLVEVTE